jgi:hypothetical protein
MGGLRAGAEPHSIASPASAAGSGEREGGQGVLRRWAAVAGYVLSGAVLFVAYLRLSETYSLNSDSANILLMGWDLLHGHLLLHGWYMSDVSFFPTELPQYALLESFLGPHMQTAHVAAAMTYTLTFLLAVLLARSGGASPGRRSAPTSPDLGDPSPRTSPGWRDASRRILLVRTLIAAGIMLAPQLGLGVFALDLSVGHIGTAIPLLLTWLLLDKVQPRWYVPVLTAVLLAWVLVADPIVYIVGIGPLGAVAAARVIRGWVRAGGSWRTRLTAVWYDLSLGAAAVAATGIAWVANNVISAAGGYTVNRPPFYLTPWHYLHNNEQAGWKLLQIFGADYRGLSGAWLVLAFLHLASVLVVGWALVRVARRFFRISLVDQVLAVAIVLNVVLYLLSNAATEAAHEVAIIVPFGAALAARVLTRRIRPVNGAIATDGDQDPASSGPTRRIRLAGILVAGTLLAGYGAGFGYELTQPSAPPANTEVASWLETHHLSYGLSGYWTSSSVTVDSDNRVQVRALMQFTMKRDLWMSNVGWYDPKLHYANFIVLDSAAGFFNHWEPRALVRKYFGRPARTYQIGRYTVLVWNRNLLNSIPR